MYLKSVCLARHKIRVAGFSGQHTLADDCRCNYILGETTKSKMGVELKLECHLMADLPVLPREFLGAI